MPRKRNRRYLIEIKDAKGVSVFFTAADWSDEEQRAAIAQIMRLTDISTEPARDESKQDKGPPQ